MLLRIAVCRMATDAHRDRQGHAALNKIREPHCAVANVSLYVCRP